jgi:CubicO group peptidase (beta-lactamase class C family)
MNPSPRTKRWPSPMTRTDTDGRRSPAAGPGPSTAPQTHTGLLAAPASAQPSAAAVPVLWPTTPAPRDGDARLAEAIAGIQASEHLPALAVAVVRSTGMEAAAVVGWRKLGDPTPATLSDCWHMGSDTKAMTASLAALLVERGQVQWDTTLGDVVPQTPSQWRSVTLNHLLTHRAGLPRNEEWKMTTTRMGMLELMAKLQPATAPGAKYSYSNLGYALVGLMMERITGVTWEAFIDKELWQPLGITGAGFGGMGTTGLVDGPWSHKLGGIVAGNGPLLDFPPCAGPAARVHISLLDWSRFIADHLRGARGMPGLLRPESYAHLHQPVPGSNYACGWMVDQRPWAKGTVLHHDGTNKVNFSVVWVAPAIDLAILVCCNEGDAGGACDAAVSAILKLLHL